MGPFYSRSHESFPSNGIPGSLNPPESGFAGSSLFADPRQVPDLCHLSLLEGFHGAETSPQELDLNRWTVFNGWIQSESVEWYVS